MTGGAVQVFAGSRLMFDGDLVEVVEFDGTRITLRNVRTGAFSAVSFARLAAGVRMEPVGEPEGVTDAVALAGLSNGQREEVEERAGHIREVLSGFRSGFAELAAPGEPRPLFAPELAVSERIVAKSEELGVSTRTLNRWIAAYQQAGVAGLVDLRLLKGHATRVDPRWDAAVREVFASLVNASTPTRSAVLRKVEALLEEQHGAGEVTLPSRSTAYARLAVLARGTNAVSGSAKGRRSIAERPQGVYGRLRATRPGEYVVLDTQDLDVYAMEEVTCRWVKTQLTVAQDLFTRCIVGLRVTAVSTKAVDVAQVLFEAVVPSADEEAGRSLAPFHGLPDQLVFSEDGAVSPGRGLCPPETIVVDHGRAFLSTHVISVCTRLGISIQPAQPKKPTDKPTVERFFKTLREGLVQHLPAYKGPDVHSRGLDVEDQAFFFVHELEDVVREWVRDVYHRAKHDGLAVPQWPGVELSPLEMLRVGIAKAGRLRIAPNPDLAYDFLQVVPRTVQHYGVEVGGLRYNGAVLDGYRNQTSPYGGRLAGRWPIRVNPDDVRFAYFQDPADGSWHRLEWEHAPGLDTAFSAEAAAYARRLATRADRHTDPAQALSQLLERWEKGAVTGRRERRMALRISADRPALPLPAPEPDTEPATGLHLVPPPRLDGDTDEDEEIFDGPDDGFYDDAFEVLQ
jgi:transposase InsO family protein